MSPLLRRLIWTVAKRAAADPRVRQAAMAAAARARPKVETAAREIRAALRETSPLADPAGFVRKLRQQIQRKR